MKKNYFINKTLFFSNIEKILPKSKPMHKPTHPEIKNPAKELERIQKNFPK